MYPRRTSRKRPHSSSGSRRQIRRLWLIAAGVSVPALVIAYGVTTEMGGHAVNTADVHSISGHFGGGDSASGDGGYGRGGYTMMPGPAGSANSSARSASEATGAVTAATSENWSGYATSGTPGTFTQVSSSWTEPTVTCTANQTFSSFWVGLDGDGTSTVEQTGTEADCDNGTAAYSGWFEMFPAAPVFYQNPVDPGDAMSASVVANGGGSFTLTLNDTTQGWTQTTNQTSNTAQLGSAEIIAEAPSSEQGVLPLSDFGTVNFTDALVNTAAIGNASTTEITMESAAGAAEATPSALTDGDAFSVTFDAAGTTGTGGGGTGGGGGGGGGGTGGGGGGGGHHHHHNSYDG